MDAAAGACERIATTERGLLRLRAECSIARTDAQRWKRAASRAHDEVEEERKVVSRLTAQLAAQATALGEAELLRGADAGLRAANEEQVRTSSTLPQSRPLP